MKLNKLTQSASALALLAIVGTVQADIITFSFTGRLVVADPVGNVLINNNLSYTPIAAELTFDTVSGLGSSDLSITMTDAFLGDIPTFHDITMQSIGDNLLDGNVLVDWQGSFNMPLHVQWDATGMFNAIDLGLQVGDTISGTNLIRGGDIIADVNSATPYSDTLQDDFNFFPDEIQGPTPLAATAASMGLGADTPFPGFKGYFDIGSGNSLHVSSIEAVPVPAAVWLFGSGLLALVGVSRRKV